MSTKKFYLSKTFWVNVLALLVFVIQFYRQDFVMPAEVLASILAIINLILRWITKEPVEW